MQTTWQTFLAGHGARFDDTQHLYFGTEADSIAQLATQPVLMVLDHLGVIRASGADAQDFLQGQFSNDIRELAQGRFQISAYCNPKGRMLAQFFVIPDGDDFLLLLPRELLAPTLQRLKMFVMRSQVNLEDVSEQRICVGLANPEQVAIPNLALPDAEYDLATRPGLIAGKLPGPISRNLLVVEAQAAPDLWTTLSAVCQPAGAAVWHWLDIQAGLPSIWLQTREEFVPQMLNLELIHGVNFKKGCYPGQEIVARMHYLGKPKRRMYRLRLDGQHSPEPGTDIYAASGDGQSAGKVVLAQSGPQATELLAVLQVDKADADLRLGAQDGPALRRAELPYPVETTIEA